MGGFSIHGLHSVIRELLKKKTSCKRIAFRLVTILMRYPVPIAQCSKLVVFYAWSLNNRYVILQFWIPFQLLLFNCPSGNGKCVVVLAFLDCYISSIFDNKGQVKR